MKITTKFHGATYTLEAPYAAGHKLTAAEAAALNRAWARGVVNVLRTRAGSKTPPEKVDKMLSEIAESYTFGTTMADPIEKRAKHLAWQASKDNTDLRAALESAGVDLTKRADTIAAIKEMKSGAVWVKLLKIAEDEIKKASALLGD